MEHSSKRPVIIRFNSREEAIDLYVRIEMRYFLYKLLYN